MGNFIFLNDAVPIQTESALLRVLRDPKAQEGGKFFSLGEDVHAIFFKPKSDEGEVSPIEAFRALMTHNRLSGRMFSPGYNQLLSVFHSVLESRKDGLNGRWFRAPTESTAEAFLRRLRSDDPARSVYEAYVGELSERWAGAKEIAPESVLEAVQLVQRKYEMEQVEYEMLANTLCENLQSSVKEATLEIEKRNDLEGSLKDGSLVVFAGDKAVENASEVKEALKVFEGEKDKFVEIVMAQKTASLDGKKKL
jgi:hypothetical protein